MFWTALSKHWNERIKALNLVIGDLPRGEPEAKSTFLLACLKFERGFFIESDLWLVEVLNNVDRQHGARRFWNSNADDGSPRRVQWRVWNPWQSSYRLLLLLLNIYTIVLLIGRRTMASDKAGLLCRHTRTATARQIRRVYKQPQHHSMPTSYSISSSLESPSEYESFE